MTWIKEVTVRDVGDEIREGARLVRRFWNEQDPPHRHLGAFHAVVAVKHQGDGSVDITYEYCEESGRHPKKGHLYYAPTDVVALAFMTELAPGTPTYAHQDSRLILPGGYLQARPGASLLAWDAFTPDGAQLGEGVNVAEGRALLAGTAHR